MQELHAQVACEKRLLTNKGRRNCLGFIYETATAGETFSTGCPRCPCRRLFQGTQSGYLFYGHLALTTLWWGAFGTDKLPTRWMISHRERCSLACITPPHGCHRLDCQWVFLATWCPNVSECRTWVPDTLTGNVLLKGTEAYEQYSKNCPSLNSCRCTCALMAIMTCIFAVGSWRSDFTCHCNGGATAVPKRQGQNKLR